MGLNGKVKSIQETSKYREIKFLNSNTLEDSLLFQKNTYLFDEEGFVFTLIKSFGNVNFYKRYCKYDYFQ